MLLENFSTLSPDTRKALVQNLVLLRNKSVITSIECVLCLSFFLHRRIHSFLLRLLKTLFPLLPRATNPTLRSFIRKTILLDIRNANVRTKNHKLNRAVQAMLFGMIERGMGDQVVGNKGKVRSVVGAAVDRATQESGDAMWAIIVTKELWRKSVWYELEAFALFDSSHQWVSSRNDAKSVSIVALGCLHPSIKVQSASIHFFLGGDDDVENSEDEEEDVRDD